MGRSVGLLALLTSVAVSFGATHAEAQTSEERAVIAAAQAVFNAMEARDPDAFRAAMTPDGFFQAIGFETTRRTGREEFASRLADAPQPMYERMWDPEVRIDGPVATIWTAYDFYRGMEFSHCGTDAMQLSRTPDGWKLISAFYTVQMPPDCATHPDGPPGGG